MENDKLIFDLHGYVENQEESRQFRRRKQMGRQVKLIIFKRCDNGARMDN